MQLHSLQIHSLPYFTLPKRTAGSHLRHVHIHESLTHIKLPPCEAIFNQRVALVKRLLRSERGSSRALTPARSEVTSETFIMFTHRTRESVGQTMANLKYPPLTSVMGFFFVYSLCVADRCAHCTSNALTPPRGRDDVTA